ncbi:hypothetical protein [Sphingobacterium bovistauri]|nr:hypothetical protein [Sphingobacterium bovistauri]
MNYYKMSEIGFFKLLREAAKAGASEALVGAGLVSPNNLEIRRN